MGTYTRNPGLKELAVLVGEWEFRSPQFPAGSGHAVFEWLEEGAFLREHQGVGGSAPDATWIFGSDGPAESQTVLYYDSRGVTRVYHSTLREGTRKVWRDAPQFWQRFSGRLSRDGDTIEGAWESSTDGVSWNHDFELAYTRVRGGPA